jgi:hypothetical protein
MGTHLVDSPHPLFIGWFVRAVWDLGDLSESTPRGFVLLPALRFTELEKLAVGSQGRGWQLPGWRTDRIWLHGLILLLIITALSSIDRTGDSDRGPIEEYPPGLSGKKVYSWGTSGIE